MAGVLSFTLGLEASNFLRGIGMASGGVLSLATAMRGIQMAASGVWGAINDGGRLADLSARTGASAGTLYQLEEAFKLVGVSADTVSPMIMRLQRAMGGVDDQGNKLDDVFSELGLNVKDLQKLDPAKQIEAIGSALARAGKDRGASLAGKLFGREGAGDIMQIARQMGDFKGALADTAGAGGSMNKTVAAFDSIMDTVQRIRTMMRGMWANLATEVAPIIQTLLDMLTRAFRTGDFSQMIGDAFRMAFDAVVGFAPAFFAKLGAILFKTFQAPLSFLQAGMEFALQKITEGVANNPLIKFALGMTGMTVAGLVGGKEGFSAESFGDIYKRYQESGPIFDLGSGEFGIEDMFKTANDAWDKAKQNFVSKWGSIVPEAIKVNGGAGLDDVGSQGKAGKNDASALEKMGFVLGGGGGNDHARSTADNTRAIHNELKTTNRLLAERPAATSTQRI